MMSSPESLKRTPNLLRRAARKLALLPLQALGADIQAEVIERLSMEAVTRTSIGRSDLAFHTPTPLLRRRAESILTKEPDTIAWLNTLRSDAVLWDVGANVGVFSVYAAAVRGCRVLAFEPSASNYYVLTRNITINRLEHHVMAYCVALSGTTGLGVLNLDSAEPGSALSQFGRPGEGSPYSSNPQPVAQGTIGFTIDDFIAHFGVAVPTHLKLDVDGLEWPILQGARSTLSDARLETVIVELSVTSATERELALALMHQCGLILSSQGPVQAAAGQAAANHVFVRRA